MDLPLSEAISTFALYYLLFFLVAIMNQYSLQEALKTNIETIPFEQILSEAIIIFSDDYKPVFCSSSARDLLML